MNVRTALKQGIAQLRQAHVPSFTLAAELLLLHVLRRDRTWLYAHPEEFISASDAERFSALLARRGHGEPTQHLTGTQEFWGLAFEVTPDVLIPRPETEHLIEVALDRLALRELQAGRKQTLISEALLIADVGTGSGCIAIALAKELPGARFIATDISAAALAVALRNAQRHSAAGRIHFLQTNLLAAVARFIVGSPAGTAPDQPSSSPAQGEPPLFDLIVSNPPYIGRHEKESLMREVRDYEPALALYGGERGYELYPQLISQAAHALKSGGLLVLELGHNSLPAVRPLLDPPNWTNVGITNDLAGLPRVIAAQRL